MAIADQTALPAEAVQFNHRDGEGKRLRPWSDWTGRRVQQVRIPRRWTRLHRRP